MEWSREKTLKLVELLQTNAPLWNPAVCESRRDKQKRKEELRHIAKILEISVGDVTKKIQHLRTQYNREAAREARFKTEDPDDRYISDWYAFEYLHFLKDASKPFKVILSTEYGEDLATALQAGDLVLTNARLTPREPPRKLPRLDCTLSPKPVHKLRDEFSVFGEYVANELRSLKGEMNHLVAKKKIQDVIFDVKMGSMHEVEEHHHPPLHPAPLHVSQGHTPTSTNMSEINSLINNCHYNNFKVDQ